MRVRPQAVITATHQRGIVSKMSRKTSINGFIGRLTSAVCDGELKAGV